MGATFPLVRGRSVTPLRYVPPGAIIIAEPAEQSPVGTSRRSSYQQPRHRKLSSDLLGEPVAAASHPQRTGRQVWRVTRDHPQRPQALAQTVGTGPGGSSMPASINRRRLTWGTTLTLPSHCRARPDGQTLSRPHRPGPPPRCSRATTKYGPRTAANWAISVSITPSLSSRTRLDFQ